MTKNIRQVTGNKSPYNRLVIGQIFEVSPETGSVSVEFTDIAGKRVLRVTHPFISANAWIRVMPEAGTYVLVGFRASTAGHAEIISYLDSDEAARILHSESDEQVATGRTTPSAGKYPFRTLQTGEFELSSYGKAAVWASRRGTLEVRGGATYSTWSNDFLEIDHKAPLHKRQMLAHSYDKLKDEERLGVVKRPTDGDKAAGWEKLVKEEGQYAREYYVHIAFEGTPNYLYERRTGHVYDDKGQKINHPDSNHWLRHREFYVTKSSKTVGYFIDENGNVLLDLPTDADVGLHFNLPGDQCTEKHDIGLDYVKKVGRNRNINIGNDSTKVIGNNFSTQIGANETRDVGGSQTESIGSSSEINVGASRKLTIGGDLEITIGGKLTITCAGDSQIIAGGKSDYLSSGLLVVKGAPTLVN